MTGAAGGPAAFGVLFVCTGNICRSPAAELLLRAELGGRVGVAVASAGLHARVGEPVAVPMARLLQARGVEPDGFAARQLEPGLLRDADLVLTMTAEQRSAVARQLPAAVRRTFTLREFADLALLADADAPAGPADRLAAVLRQAPLVRARRRVGSPDDIEDPYQRPERVHAAVLGAIEAAVADLLSVLAPPKGDVA